MHWQGEIVYPASLTCPSHLGPGQPNLSFWFPKILGLPECSSKSPAVRAGFAGLHSQDFPVSPATPSLCGHVSIWRCFFLPLCFVFNFLRTRNQSKQCLLPTMLAPSSSFSEERRARCLNCAVAIETQSERQSPSFGRKINCTQTRTHFIRN